MLRDLHTDYRKALEAARNADSDEARQAAQDDVIAKRHALDDAIIEVEEARELERQVEAEEARTAAAKKAANIKAVTDCGLPVDEIRALARGERSNISPVTLEARTDLTNEVSSTYAGYTVPQSWAADVVNFQIAGSGVLRAGPTIITTAGGNQINMTTLATDAAAATGAEGVASTQSNPVFGQALLNAWRFDLNFGVSDELLADTAVNIPALLRVYAGRALAAKINPYFADPDVGDGSSTIACIQLGASHGVSGVDYTAGPDLDDLKTLMYSVLPEYRMSGNAAFVANSAVTLNTAMAKNDNGDYVWQPANMAGEPDRLFGYPWFEDAYMDSLATGNEPALFGSVKDAYMVRYGMGGLEFSASRDFAFTSHEITFRAAVWVDAVTVDAIAVKTIVLS